jgi:polyisoprenoid-binding protein YceI
MTSTTKLTELTGDYVLDPALTRVGFVARHTMATKVPGHFETFEGHAHLDGDDPSKSTAHLTIHAASIQTHNPRRDRALRDKFLDAPTHHPLITFTSTKIDQVTETTFAVTGDLTIRGTTKAITIDFALTNTGPGGLTFEGNVPINRRDWGAHWSAAGFLVSKQVLVQLAVTAIRHS